MIASSKFFDHVLTGSQGERHNGNRTGLVCGKGEDTRVTDIKIRNVVTLREAVGHKLFRVIAEATGTRLVQALPWRKRIIAGPPDFPTCRFYQLCADLLTMFPHQHLIGSPLEVEARHRDSVDVFHIGIKVQVVGLARKGWSLNEETDRRGIVALDIALEMRPKTSSWS